MKKNIVVILLGAALLAGCASHGNQNLKNLNMAEVKQSIVEGKTTKAEVEAKYGTPDMVSFTDSGNEIWMYQYLESTPHASNFIPVVGMFRSSSDTKTNRITVMFDQKGIVKKISANSSDSVTNAGILGK